jgi:4-hydroxybenzoate polyprenyltransferase
MSAPGKVRAVLATLRIANGPSVISNVWLGWVIAAMAWGGPVWDLAAGPGPLVPALAGLLLYFAGNLANDWFDRGWDRERRPERALPAGLFQPASYLAASILLLLGGVLLAFSCDLRTGVTALVITAFIALYTAVHKRTPWSVIPMGLCRAGLYVLGFFAGRAESVGSHQGYPLDTLSLTIVATVVACACGGLLAYIAGLSMSARYEGMPDAPPGPKLLSRLLLAFPLLALSCVLLPIKPDTGWIGMVPFGIWLALCLSRYRQPIPAHVSALLAGIPLVDAIFLLPASLIASHDGNLGAGSPWLIAGVPLAAFVLGRALQRLAPAT